MSAMAPHGQVGHAPPKTGRFAAKPVDCAAGCAPPIANARTNETESRRRMSIVFSARATASYDYSRSSGRSPGVPTARTLRRGAERGAALGATLDSHHGL